MKASVLVTSLFQIHPFERRSYLYALDLALGGVLEFEMSDVPSSEFGLDRKMRPASFWSEEGFVAVPGIEAPRTFQQGKSRS